VDPQTPEAPIRPAGSPRTSPPASTGPILYKGAELNAERGPGLGCFRFQLIVLAILIIATPLSVTAGAPAEVSTVLLFMVLGLLLLTGQTIIFLLRLVAAERRGRRRPLASSSMTVGQIEEARASPGADEGSSMPPAPSSAQPGGPTDAPANHAPAAAPAADNGTDPPSA
jgi:hypothetical protein